MQPALQGALIGLALGLFLVAAEWLLLKKAARERAERLHRSAELDETGRKRIRSVAGFSAFLPPAFALAFWIIWG
jgi:hypothetical protein